MRLIDADVFLKKCLCHLEIMVGRGNGKTIISAARQIAKEIMKETVEEMPTVEAKPVVYAHWENEHLNRYGHLCHCCSNCGFSASHKDKNWCANCGAQMDEVVSDTNVGSKTDEPISQAYENDKKGE